MDPRTPYAIKEKGVYNILNTDKLCLARALVVGAAWVSRDKGSLNVGTLKATWGTSFSSDIAVDASGSAYTTGFFTLTVDFDPGAGTANIASVAGSLDIFVSKLDAGGNFLGRVVGLHVELHLEIHG